MKSTILQTNGLCKKYGTFSALKPFDMELHVGDIYALIGKNGAGKTTFLKMITGQIMPTEGFLTLFGKIDQKDIEKERRKLGAIIEEPAFFPNFTAYQNLEYYRIQRGIPDRACVQAVLEETRLEKVGKKKFKNFSLGMKQRLGIALALMTHPAFLILDVNWGNLFSCVPSV